MSEAFTQFEKRLENLERKHRDLAKGYVAKINPDGLILVKPKPKRSGFKLRILTTLVVAVLLFKSFTLAMIGPLTYDSRIEALLQGTWLERACGWVMQADPLSMAIANFLIKTFA
jgi:hypothetical protein